jgi:hypothetical protein
MHHLIYIKTIIDELSEASGKTKAQVTLKLLTSNLNHYFQDISIENMAYLLDTSRKDIVRILKKLFGRKSVRYINSYGIKITTAKERSWFIRNHKNKCLTLLKSYKSHTNLASREKILNETLKEQ